MHTEPIGEDKRFLHLSDHLLPRFSAKRGVSLDQLEQQNAQGPDIYLEIIGFLLNHLWRHVLKSATEGAAILQNGGKPKIA